jgi:serine/threonine-protein kinase
MKIHNRSCDPDLLQLLAEDRLPAAELTGLEEHLESCSDCRQALDVMVDGDGCLTAARRHLRADVTEPYEWTSEPDEALAFLAPSDWPDSLGRLGPYEVKGVLDRGGMGLVLKAFDPSLSRNVAVKVLSPSLANRGASRQRFLREARAAAAVVHEHVVGVFAVVESSGLPFLVMEYVPGRSLQQRLDKQGPLSLPEVLRIGMQTAAGLAAAHAQGLVHRDVKPANILLEDGVERVRLTDFGLARAVDDAALTQSGVVAGTPHYMAPEQARGDSVDHRADLFSLGSTLYAMCAGHPPFRADTPLAVLRRVCDHQPRPLREINPDVPPWLVAIIARLTAKDPSRRYQTASEVAGLLERCLAHVQQPLTSPLPAELSGTIKLERVWQSLESRSALAALALVTLGAAAFVLIPKRANEPAAPRADAAIAAPENARTSQTPSPVTGRSDEIAQGFQEAWGLAGNIEAGLHQPANPSCADPVSSLSSSLAQEARALEVELSPPVLLTRPSPTVRPALNPDRRR